MRPTAFADYAPRLPMRLADDPSRVFITAYPGQLWKAPGKPAPLAALKGKANG